MKVTFVSMAHTDGHTATYNVYQGHLRKDNTIHYNSHTKLVGSIFSRIPSEFCYRCIEERYAAYSDPPVPPVPWVTHEHTC